MTRSPRSSTLWSSSLRTRTSETRSNRFSIRSSRWTTCRTTTRSKIRSSLVQPKISDAFSTRASTEFIPVASAIDRWFYFANLIKYILINKILIIWWLSEGRGSQPFGFRIPPNRKLLVNLTFCVPPRVARVPKVENRWTRGYAKVKF